jgi:catechol 2,3-dioxygenase-like lactoylglutathione lyase family enzyme
MAAVGFTTRDISALDRYLRARGVKIEQPLRNNRLAVRDPEGNLVVFIQSGAEKAVATAAVSSKATSTRLIHAGFLVHDADKENTFWKDILGFRPLWHGGRTEADTDWISLQVPDGTDWVEYMLNAPPQPTLKQAGGMYHISLGTPHMQQVVDALARNHCEGTACTAMKLGRDGKMQLNLFDPDQTRVEFMEFKPTQEPCCSPFTGKFPGPEEDQ